MNKTPYVRSSASENPCPGGPFTQQQQHIDSLETELFFIRIKEFFNLENVIAYSAKIVGDTVPFRVIRVQENPEEDTDVIKCLNCDCECYTLMYFNNHVCAPQINGANGEATGTDDLDNALHQLRGVKPLDEIQSQPLPSVRQLKNKQNNKRTTNNQNAARRNAENKIKPNNVPTNKDHELAGLPGNIDEPKEINKPPTKKPTKVTLYYQDRGLSMISGQFVINPFLPDIPDGPIQAICTSYGSADVYQEVEANVGLLPLHVPRLFRVVNTPGFRRYDANGTEQSFPPQDFEVLSPLYDYIARLIPSARSNCSTRDAALAYTEKHGVVLHNYEREVHGTLQYFEAMKFYRETVLSGSLVSVHKTTNNFGLVGFDVVHTIDNLTIGARMVDTYCSVKIPDVDKAGNIEYQARKDFKIQNIRGIVNIDERRPLFHLYDAPGTQVFSRGRTAFCRLLGAHPFVAYGNGANNMNHAMKRLVGARVGEDTYRVNAWRLGRLLYRHSHKHLLYRYNPLTLIGEWKCPDEPDWLLGAVTPNVRNTAFDGVIQMYNQFMANNFGRHVIMRFIDNLKSTNNWAYYKIAEHMTYAGSNIVSRSYAAHLPAIKKKTRVAFFNGTKYFATDETAVGKRTLTAHLKDEWSKYNKPARIFISYGGGCTFAPELPELVKVCLDQQFTYTTAVGCDIHVFETRIIGKPSTHDLTTDLHWLKESWEIRNVHRILIFSDDSCYCGNYNGLPYGYNVDISSNDAAQSLPAFYAVYEALTNFDEERAAGLMRMCRMPIKVTNPDCQDDSFEISFDTAFEGSGTLITTILNHFATLINAMCFFQLLISGQYDIELAIVCGAQIAGHEVTIENIFGIEGPQFATIEKLQFLKYSLLKCSDDQYHAVLNDGPLLRGFGTSEDDITAVKLGVDSQEFRFLTHDERMNRYLGAVVAGLKYSPETPTLRALRDRFKDNHVELKLDTVVNELGIDTKDKSKLIVERSSWLRRYDLTESDLRQLESDIANLQLGRFYTNKACAGIYHVDYGVNLT